MASTVLALLILQFLVATVFWVGSARLRRFQLERGPGWVRVELTRAVLPLLMVVAGLLFFSCPLAPLWSPVVGLPWDSLGGIEPQVGRLAFLGMNLLVAGVAVAATGGTPRSPFVALVVLVPVIGWGAGVPLLEAGGATLLAGVLLVVTAQRRWVMGPAGPEPHLGWSRGAVMILGLIVLAAALWMGPHLP
jgi:hypothetical protein